MNARLEALALQRQSLIARSALGRLRLRRDAYRLRRRLELRPLASAAARTPAIRTAVLGFALALLGPPRVARAVAIATRLLVVAKVARLALGVAAGNRSVRRRDPS